MSKMLVYNIDALNPELLEETLKKDIENAEIEEIIIPDFVLKEAYEKKYFSKVISQLQTEKITIKNFPIMYSQKYSNHSYFILFMLQISKNYKNLYVRTCDNELMLEYIKNGFKVFLDNEYTDIFEQITSENSIVAKSSIAFFDTCYYVEKMFKDSYIGLNILKDSSIKKIIYTAVLEELLKIGEKEIFKTLLYFINNQKEYNIEVIKTEKTYTEPHFNHDLMMLSYVMKDKRSKEITVYTLDYEFITQCMALNISVSNGENLTNSSISECIKTDVKNEIDKKQFEKESNALLNNISEEGSENLDENNKPDKFIKLPIKIKNNITYISLKYVDAVYESLPGRLYSNILGKKGQEQFYQIRPTYYLKLHQNSNAYKVRRIDREKLEATLERTTFNFEKVNS